LDVGVLYNIKVSANIGVFWKMDLSSRSKSRFFDSGIDLRRKGTVSFSMTNPVYSDQFSYYRSVFIHKRRNGNNIERADSNKHSNNQY
jgi:hypothetical protein